MVYNTSDNRSSLSITDLTSDGEYTVTVAGRDGAGRLGQESDKLKLNCKYNENFSSFFVTLHVIVFESGSADKTISIEHKFFLFDGEIYGTFVHWNVCMKLFSFNDTVIFI